MWPITWHIPVPGLLVGSMLFLVPEAEEEAGSRLAWGTFVDSGLAKSVSSSDLWLGATIVKAYFLKLWIYTDREKIKNNILKKCFMFRNTTKIPIIKKRKQLCNASFINKNIFQCYITALLPFLLDPINSLHFCKNDFFRVDIVL